LPAAVVAIQANTVHDVDYCSWILMREYHWIAYSVPLRNVLFTHPDQTQTFQSFNILDACSLMFSTAGVTPLTGRVAVIIHYQLPQFISYHHHHLFNSGSLAHNTTHTHTHIRTH